MVDLIKCQIRMANLTTCKSQWPLNMVNLTKPSGHFDGPLAFMTRCLICHMVKKVTFVKYFSKK